MKIERDPRDWHYRERLAASTLASLVLHALLALLLVSIIASSSQEGATENVEGGSIVTLERQTAAVVANQPSAAHAAQPIVHVPRIAPPRHAALSQPQTQRLPQNRHELVHEVPSAPPNPRPLPQQTVQPNPQPTQNVYEVHPRTELPAAPVSVPTAAPVAVALKTTASAAPSPAPTAVATALRSPRPSVPTAAPTSRATPAPVASIAPSTAPAAVRASAAPSASPAPAARASAPPAPRSGVPSPSATAVAAVSKTAGAAASPGPKGVGSPGPHAGTGPKTQPAPARPIELHPTPSPAPRGTKTPATPPNINAKLRSLLPNNPVNPASKQYTPEISLHGSLEPTPPPNILAQTKYLYRSRPGGSEARVEMWVTSIKKVGVTTMCTGWLVRYPFNQTAPHAGDFAPANGTQVTVGGGRGVPAVLPPVVEGMVTEACEGRLLAPYAPLPAPSP